MILILLSILQIAIAQTEAIGADCNCYIEAPVSMPDLTKLDSVLKSSVYSSDCKDEKVCKIVAPWAQATAKKHPHCAKYFINDKGEVGALSKLLVNEISKDIKTNTPKGDSSKSNSVFLQNYPDIIAVCPGFKDMNAVQKISFWTYAFEILGFLESTCDPSKLNNAKNVPHGPATGLYQLEPTPELRGWRGPNCKKYSQAEILEPEANTACAIDVVKGMLKRNKRFFGMRNPEGKKIVISYWESLNPLPKGQDNIHDDKRFRELPRNKMLRYLSQFPLCK